MAGPPLPAHLRPSAPTAADALLCGDPARALAIAQVVLDAPRMSNHHRGLWGYHGHTERGAELTVQSTGIGGPSAAIVIAELAELGVRRAIRIGTCAAPAAEPALGTRLVVAAARAGDGASQALGAPAGGEVDPDPTLTARLAGDELDRMRVASADLPPAPAPDGPVPEPPVGDLQTATVLQACRVRGISAAAGLVVGTAAGRRLDDEPLESRLLDLAKRAAGALEP